MRKILKRFHPSQFNLRPMAVDTLAILFSLYLSLWLRLGEAELGDHLAVLNQLAIGFVLIRLVVLQGFGVYQCMWRYTSTDDAIRLSLAVLVSTPVMVSLTYLFSNLGFLPRSFFAIDTFVCLMFLMGMRLVRRRIFESSNKGKKSAISLGKLLIYGAGQNGRLLAQRLINDPNRDRDLLGFIDDDSKKQDKRIQGLPVLGGLSDLEAILGATDCTDLIVAITHPAPELMRDLVLLGRKLNVRVQRIAQFEPSQILSQTEAIYRQIELKDLLNRPTSEIDVPSVSKLMRGKVVLVTGAGGSIGAELCRQILRFQPAKLLLLDHSEYNLFEIDRELRPATQNFQTVQPLLVDIKDTRALEHVFTTHAPQVVFHAAAYKHVHLVEANVASAVLNNIKGTQNLLTLCDAHTVERFVMVSTDKAVHPVGAMGATKRVCEILTSLTGLRTGVPYSSVRFGNVLGSSGSLIPLLKQQILDGGPVTLTHPDMNRYFMLIPEAVSLILMSATLSQPGDINVLKMGEPIRILDLAKSLIALMGKAEDEIGIAFTGVRPGEKMFEELYLTGNESSTHHPDILTMPRGDHAEQIEARQVENLLHEVKILLEHAENNQPELLPLLLKMANADATQDKSSNATKAFAPQLEPSR